jgi:archaellum component FlaC
MAALSVVLAATAAAPAVASAGTVKMRGVVSGSPYGASNGQMAVPVLYSKMTVHDVGLKSPVGVIILKRSQQVKLPNGAGYTTPANLRTGDRFKGLGVVNPLQKKVFYSRVAFPKAVVYFRSKELSLAEMSAAIDAIRKALLDLQNQLNALQGATLAGFQNLLGQINDLRKQIEALQALTNQVSSLTNQVTNLANQITSLLTQVTSLQNQVTTLISQVTTLTQNLATVCNAVKNATVDPDGAGPLPPVSITFPPGTITTVCP